LAQPRTTFLTQGVLGSCQDEIFPQNGKQINLTFSYRVRVNVLFLGFINWRNGSSTPFFHFLREVWGRSCLTEISITIQKQIFLKDGQTPDAFTSHSPSQLSLEVGLSIIGQKDLASTIQRTKNFSIVRG
jgi:hypothetical protein